MYIYMSVCIYVCLLVLLCVYVIYICFVYLYVGMCQIFSCACIERSSASMLNIIHLLVHMYVCMYTWGCLCLVGSILLSKGTPYGMVWQVMSCDVLLYCYVMSYYIAMLCPIILLCYVLLYCYVISYYIAMLCYNMVYYVIVRHFVLLFFILWYVMLCSVMVCHAIICLRVCLRHLCVLCIFLRMYVWRKCVVDSKKYVLIYYVKRMWRSELTHSHTYTHTHTRTHTHTHTHTSWIGLGPEVLSWRAHTHIHNTPSCNVFPPSFEVP